MNTGKAVIAGAALLVIAGLSASPVQAHRRYRPHFKGLPRHIIVQHSHDSKTSTKPSLAAGAKVESTESFELFNETTRIITGTVKIVDDMISTLLGGRAEAAHNMQKVKSQ